VHCVLWTGITVDLPSDPHWPYPSLTITVFTVTLGAVVLSWIAHRRVLHAYGLEQSAALEHSGPPRYQWFGDHPSQQTALSDARSPYIPPLQIRAGQPHHLVATPSIHVQPSVAAGAVRPASPHFGHTKSKDKASRPSSKSALSSAAFPRYGALLVRSFDAVQNEFVIPGVITLSLISVMECYRAVNDQPADPANGSNANSDSTLWAYAPRWEYGTLTEEGATKSGERSILIKPSAQPISYGSISGSHQTAVSDDAVATGGDEYHPDARPSDLTRWQRSLVIVEGLVICMGWFALLGLIYVFFASPTVLARFASGSYLAINVLVMASPLTYLMLSATWPGLYVRIPLKLVIFLDIMFLIALALSSTADLAMRPELHLIQQISVYLAIVLSPLLFMHFTHMSFCLRFVRATLIRRVVGFTVASMTLLFLVSGSVMVLASSYVGLRFLYRMYWLVTALIVSLASLGSWLALHRFRALVKASGHTFVLRYPEAYGLHVSRRTRLVIGFTASAMLILVVILTAVLVPRPNTGLEAPAPADIKIITYNMEQGTPYQAPSHVAFSLRAN